MRAIALVLTCALCVASTSPARADVCTFDSECPTGMVCNSAGGCETPSGSTNSGGSKGLSTAGIVVGLLLVGVLLWSLTWDFSDDDAARVLPLPVDEGLQASEPGGLTVRF